MTRRFPVIQYGYVGTRRRRLRRKPGSGCLFSALVPIPHGFGLLLRRQVMAGCCCPQSPLRPPRPRAIPICLRVRVLIVICPFGETIYSNCPETLRKAHNPLQPGELRLHMPAHRSLAKLTGQVLHRPRLVNLKFRVALWCLCLPGLPTVFLPLAQRWWLPATIASQISLSAAVNRGAPACRSNPASAASVFREGSVSSAEGTRTFWSIVWLAFSGLRNVPFSDPSLGRAHGSTGRRQDC